MGEEGRNEARHEGSSSSGSDEGHEGDEEKGSNEACHEGSSSCGSHEGHEGDEEKGSNEACHEGSCSSCNEGNEGDEEEGSNEARHEGSGCTKEGHEGHESHEMNIVSASRQRDVSILIYGHHHYIGCVEHLDEGRST